MQLHDFFTALKFSRFFTFKSFIKNQNSVSLRNVRFSVNTIF